MQATDVKVFNLLEGAKQFIIPLFQRDYSWGTKECDRLLRDVEKVGISDAPGHFVGSVVYVPADDSDASIPRWLLIDGQQRLTTITLLLIAVRDIISASETDNSVDPSLPTVDELNDNYLINRHARSDDRRTRLHLRNADHSTLYAAVMGQESPSSPSERISENIEFFREQVSVETLPSLWRGVKKLIAVDVKLDRRIDDPQMIFESLNSTGVDLSQGDLIRNFVLMRLDEEIQSRFYRDYWQPIETIFGARYGADFDGFIRDYLTIRLQPNRPFKTSDVYSQFKAFYPPSADLSAAEQILQEIKRYSAYYAAFHYGRESNKALAEPLKRLRQLVEVASPAVLKLYSAFDNERTLTVGGFVEALEVIESYVFRRSICEMQTRSLGQIFASIAYRIKKSAPLDSLKVTLARQSKTRRFPSDAEFVQSLQSRNIYEAKTRHYLLSRLTNDTRERIDTSNLTIEHIMPQSENLPQEWRKMLGDDWRAIHDKYLHRLGNLTLTGYNAEYSNRPFADKKSFTDKEGRQVGLDYSPVRINDYVRDADRWTGDEIDERGRLLAGEAVRIWRSLTVDERLIREAALEDRKRSAADYEVGEIPFDENAKALFEKLQTLIKSMGEDVHELGAKNSAVYVVYDFFVEIIPRRNKLAILLNLDFEECEDPEELARDATEWAYITNASERGGVLATVTDSDEIPSAVDLIRQAYEKATE